MIRLSLIRLRLVGYEQFGYDPDERAPRFATFIRYLLLVGTPTEGEVVDAKMS